MKRRRFLKGAFGAGVASLAGCTQVLGQVQRQITVESVDDHEEEYDLSMDVEMVKTDVTPEHTAELKITATNQNREQYLRLRDKGCRIFENANTRGGASDPPGLWLHLPETSRFIERKGDKWTRDKPQGQGEHMSDLPPNIGGCEKILYSPPSSREQPLPSFIRRYWVWDDYQVEGYMDPGTYRFEEPIEVFRKQDDSEDEKITGLTWGFSLKVERS
ncbi:MAG: hypothetical protein SV377_07650 [Halobacteria archaeon]|nr:hypothetical protein [Halobacteria archaeon]